MGQYRKVNLDETSYPFCTSGRELCLCDYCMADDEYVGWFKWILNRLDKSHAD